MMQFELLLAGSLAAALLSPSRLVINDPIGVCVERNQIILRRPDGKDYKAKIVRAIRTRH